MLFALYDSRARHAVIHNGNTADTTVQSFVEIQFLLASECIMQRAAGLRIGA